ncbi:MAG: helix-turn-helix domain-containing protein, partial [Chloroflexota bacterium]
MANKTYNQYCAIANALDIVGERWTLLVVRNLLAGSKRFSDLQKGLPGISTNVLTDRLKKLEANDTIASRYLP